MNVVEVLSLQQSGSVQADPAFCRSIWSFRWVMTSKTIEDRAEHSCLIGEDTMAKCCWVVLGPIDFDLQEISKFPPVLSKDAFFVLLQVLASYHLELCRGDVSSAFVDGNDYRRKGGGLCIDLPSEEVPASVADCFLLLKVVVVGLGDGLLCWFLLA
jgi:hypothetical protein